MADKGRSDIDNADLETDFGRKPETAGSVSTDEQARRQARRKILTGGLAGAPFIVTLSSRPALATFCSPSATPSGNLSKAGGPVICSGLTPGYWKTHEEDCSNYIIVGPCNPITLDGGQCDDFSVPTVFELEEHLSLLEQDSWQNRQEIRKIRYYLYLLETYPGLDSPPFGTPFSEIFGSGFTQDSTTTMMQSLWLDDEPPLPPDGAGESSPVLAHSAAAWLNACKFGKEEYGMSHDEVAQLVAEKILVDPFGLKDMLQELNERGYAGEA